MGLIISAAEHAKFSSSTSMADLEQIYIHNLDFYSLEQVISLDSLICSPFNNMIFVSQVKKKISEKSLIIYLKCANLYKSYMTES